MDIIDFEITKKGTLKRRLGGTEEHASDTVKLLYAIYQKLKTLEQKLTPPTVPSSSFVEEDDSGTATNVNTASFEKLVELPSIGEVSAQRIIDARPLSNLTQAKKTVKGVDWNAIAKLIAF